MNKYKLIIILVITVFIKSSAQTILPSDYNFCANEESENCLYDYFYGHEEKIRVNDSIPFIKKILKRFNGKYFKNTYLENYTVSDSIFLRHFSSADSQIFNNDVRSLKRLDFIALFYIQFELFIKDKIKKDKYITTIYLRPKRKLKHSYSYYWRENASYKYMSKSTYPNFELGKAYRIVDEQYHLIYPDEISDLAKNHNKQMKKIYKVYLKWIKEVEKLGSLEEARRQGLYPLKNSEYKWAIEYFEIDDSGNVKKTTEFFE